MAKGIAISELQGQDFPLSPEYVRISMAAAIGLGLKSGRLYRQALCKCINLLENYPEGCYANCAYCGLARERPGLPESNTFIRVAWPVYATDLVAEKIADAQARGNVGRVCVSQVQDRRANIDLIDIIDRVRHASPESPISALVNATTLDENWLLKIKEAGADIIGVGLDAASRQVFYQTRGRGVNSPHDWDGHWQIVQQARKIYGPMNVNCHVVVGLGETDRELVELFLQLKSEQVASFLFSFNPEPGTAMQQHSRPDIRRWRRIQLVKYLIYNDSLSADAFHFDEAGNLLGVDLPIEVVRQAVRSGIPFMTNGCPDRQGELACNRPYGSYRPGEDFRDYPFLPTPEDVLIIQKQLQPQDLWPGWTGLEP